MNPDPAGYYDRQIVLPEIGPEGQRRLKESSVLVIGAGGLGSPLLMSLVGAGVGRIHLVEADVVSPSNLNRQFLYQADEIGLRKADRAMMRLRAYHPDLDFTASTEWLTPEAARELFPRHDLIAAAVDSIATRRLINKVCCELGKSFVDGGLRGFSGYAASIVPGKTPCFDCLFGHTETPLHEEAPRIGSTHGSTPPGALGATAGVIGSLQATLVILRLLGLPDPLQGELLYYHGKTMEFSRMAVERTPGCLACGSLFHHGGGPT